MDSQRLCLEGTETWEIAMSIGVIPRAIHIAGNSETEAGNPSRVHQANYKWCNQHKYIKAIFNTWGYPQLDLCVTADAKKSPEFCLLVGDALQIPWSGTLCYVFPPFPLLNKGIGKMVADWTDCILVAAF